MCQPVFKIFNIHTFQQFAYVYIKINCLLILPVVAFMILDDPHDCFMCLGKDPDRPYSIFQLSREERANRKMVAKYGKQKALKSSSQVGDMRITIKDLLIRDQFKNRACHQSEMVGNYETLLQTSVNRSIVEDENVIIYNDEVIHRYGGTPVS